MRNKHGIVRAVRRGLRLVEDQLLSNSHWLEPAKSDPYDPSCPDFPKDPNKRLSRHGNTYARENENFEERLETLMKDFPDEIKKMHNSLGLYFREEKKY